MIGMRRETLQSLTVFAKSYDARSDRCVKSPYVASLWRPRSTLRVPAVPLQFGVHPSRR